MRQKYQFKVSKNNIVIREIKREDDAQVAKMIRAVLIEFGVPKVGTAYADSALDCMTETYGASKTIYYVLDDLGKVIGGAGIAPLEGEEGICELQKMYFLPEARGTGLGSDMMATCLNKAKEFGFEKCYLETLPYMKAATKLYAKAGFEPLEGPLGNTGHYSCNVWMIKNL
ncbi:GNAT family N-acetyltransferase [Mangrovimonas sp. YM274]|uniref:GNAT family N-acetyltransferase n=1 Tax=Mangrovimonas sp. YM274 TaxID=3070660 RepID=UPI0027DC9ABC|nr:GNAT family N-acetyltransferase [Mangrovimonas sp. YM274]WMI67619.1 GNAT family N-acetyltransferase [Mangrovimonas sp. YM274]